LPEGCSCITISFTLRSGFVSSHRMKSSRWLVGNCVRHCRRILWPAQVVSGSSTTLQLENPWWSMYTQQLCVWW
jgi:hypothetical protein